MHVNEPGRTGWDCFASAIRAAAAGGVTTIVDMPLNALPRTVDVGLPLLRRRVGLGRKEADRGGGADADLTFTVGQLHHRNPITPYAGRELHGAVRSTWLRGEPVDVGGVPRGRLLSREGE